MPTSREERAVMNVANFSEFAVGKLPQHVADDLTIVVALARAALSADTGTVEALRWRDIASAPKDGTLVLLLVDYSGDDADHYIDDSSDGLGRTIGHNNDDNVLPDEAEGWQFAGWCWTHDHYVEGRGKPIGWMPLPPSGQAPEQGMDGTAGELREG